MNLKNIALKKKVQAFIVKLLMNVRLVSIFVFIITIFSIYLSFKNQNWLWFSRFGSVTTLSGGILATRKLLRNGIKGIEYCETHISSGRFNDKPQLGTEESRDLIATKCAFVFISIGTLIWGFGDLINSIHICNVGDLLNHI